MQTPRTPLFHVIQQVVELLPAAVVSLLAEALAPLPSGAWPEITAAAARVLAVPFYRAQMHAFIATWQQEAPDLAPASVAFALEAAASALAQQRQAQTLELVWTGPASRLPLRRTAQVLHDVIDAAQHELLIVSFAVYAIPEIRQALLRAAERGVHITLVIESPSASAGKLAYDSLAAFGARVRAHAAVYYWPFDQRPTDADGRHGSLHAKCAIADQQTLLISSANLTHYALNLNMELGILVRGGALPQRVHQHIDALIHATILQPVQQPN